MPGDNTAIKNDFRFRAKIAVGNTVTKQLIWLKEQFQIRFDTSTGGDGFKVTSASQPNSSYAGVYPGATDQEVATALRQLIHELQGNGSKVFVPDFRHLGR